MRRRTLTTLAMLSPLIAAACGKEESDADDLKRLTAMIPLLSSDAAAPSADGELQQAIQSLIGKTMDITWVPNANYPDKTNVVLASDDIPEVMVIQGKTSNFVQSAEAGAFWDLTDRLADYPYLTADDEDVQMNASVNGTVYGLYRRRDPMRVAVMVRKDWLTQLGMELPTTTEDLYTIARAFRDNDMGGTGNTYGLIIPKWSSYASASPYDIIETWFGAPNAWGERDGQLVPGFDTDEFFEAEVFIKRMVDEKLINADFATMDSTKWNEPFFNGEGGIIVDLSSRSGELIKLFKEKYPDSYPDYVDLTGNLIGPSGTKYSYPTSGYSGLLAISRQSVPTEDELGDVLATLNTLASEEGQILLNNGVENRNFTVSEGYAITSTSEDADVQTLVSNVTAFAQFGTQCAGYTAYTNMPAGDYEREIYERRLVLHAEDMETAVNNPGLAIVSDTYMQKGAQLDTIIADARIKFLAGELDEAGLRSEIARWHSEGGDQIIDEMNEEYAAIK